ncbi:hypothetical protein [Cryptosporangium sp. NPDC051539]|uniref:hypothetical protein n=1 Tax=Cryptosporangium sp. NPDC051539 TaxID=3363962 RepID=UPI0037AEFD6F
MTLSENDRYILEHRVAPLITADVIAEQRADPFGRQSPDLTEVLDFLRRSPDPDLPRYIVLDTADGYEVAVRADTPGDPPVSLAPREVLPDRGAAEHAIFLHRLRDYGVAR